MPIPSLTFAHIENPVNDRLVPSRLAGESFSDFSYADKVRAIFGSSLIDYRRLNEGAGTALIDSSPKLHANGTLSGATWTAGAGPDGGYAPLFDGVNDYGDIYSAGLNADFNGQLLTLAMWFKVSAVGVWTDAANRVLLNLRVDVNNRLVITKTSTN